VGLIDDLDSDNLTPNARAAWRAAEDATLVTLRSVLEDLKDTWTRFSKYLLAFKHGGLVANRDDFHVLAGDGTVVDPAIAVWLRRKHDPHAHGNAESAFDIDDAVEQLELRSEMALDVIDLAIAPRLGMAELAAAGPPASRDGMMQVTVPARFRVAPDALSRDAREELERIGITFKA
jgi:hypothetical protein